LSRRLVRQVLWAVDGRFVSYNDLQGALEDLWMSGAGSAEEQGILLRHGQRCVEAALSPEILTFLYRT